MTFPNESCDGEESSTLDMDKNHPGEHWHSSDLHERQCEDVISSRAGNNSGDIVSTQVQQRNYDVVYRKLLCLIFMGSPCS